MADRFGTRRVFAWAIGTLHFRLPALRHFEQHPSARRLPCAARFRRGDDGAGGTADLVRTFPKSELIRAMSFVAIPGLIGPMLGPVAGGFIVGYFHWRMIFFINLPIGLSDFTWSIAICRITGREHSPPLDLVGLDSVRPGHRVAGVCAGSFWRTYFGGGTLLALLAVSAICLVAYGMRAGRIKFPLLRLTLFRIRTFRASVSGSFFTRLGIGGIPFLFPLLYQVGLGFTPIQSGLLIMPQALAAMSLKFVTMPAFCRRFGYRRVLIFNTLMLGVMTLSFATIGAGTPVWLIVMQVFIFGLFTSLQYTSMNTLVLRTSARNRPAARAPSRARCSRCPSALASRSASLLTAFFIPDRFHTSAPEMIHGIHLPSLSWADDRAFRHCFPRIEKGMMATQTQPAQGRTTSLLLCTCQRRQQLSGQYNHNCDDQQQNDECKGSRHRPA
jgi:MFS family permease